MYYQTTNNMEHFEMVFKNFLDMQQKTLGIIYDNNPIKSLSLGKEYLEVIENNIKFHNAAISYHKSIVDMNEVLKDNINLFNPNKK